MDKYSSTLLAQDSSTTESQKVALDLLKKINETNGAAYQKDDIDLSWYGILAAAKNEAINIQGMKKELVLTYVSSDTLSISYGIVEVNGELIYKSSATSITSALTNYPSAGSWAYVVIDGNGDISLRAATGAASVRPSDACFSFYGSGGFNELKKYGFYYDSTHKIIAAFHKISSTNFYIINVGPGLDEAGSNSNGGYVYTLSGVLICIHNSSVTSSSSTSNYFGTTAGTVYYGDYTWTYPIATDRAYLIAPKIIPGSEANSVPAYYSATTTNTKIRAVNQSNTACAISMLAIGFWR
jgi:hypothetical protein